MIFERKFCSVQGELVIRSLRNKDLSFYKKWYVERHLMESLKEKGLSENELEKMIAFESKANHIFIVEMNNKPIGEIIIASKPPVKTIKQGFKHAYHRFEFQFYENIPEQYFRRILGLFIEGILHIKKNGMEISL